MKPKILYVDDEQINLDLLKLSFRKEYEIFTALSAQEAYAILEEHPDIRLVISDLKMPEVDGMTFIKAVKAKYHDTICMLLTGFLESEVMLEGFNKELIFRYIVKPWRKDGLLKDIEEALQRSRTL
jgi:response regulator RpfG family c-di-GMP phosphodiesterase